LYEKSIDKFEFTEIFVVGSNISLIIKEICIVFINKASCRVIEEKQEKIPYT